MREAKDYVTLTQFCKITGLSRSNTYRRIKAGKLPVFRYSGKILIPTYVFESEKGGQANERNFKN